MLAPHRPLLLAARLALQLPWPIVAQAAGGHFSVDDAVILEPGQAQVETWLARDDHGHRLTEHIAPAARVGPVELGLDVARFAMQATGSPWFWTPQLKWATPVLTEQWSAGITVSGSWQAGNSLPVGYTVLVPVTWHPTDPLLVHLNVGRDIVRDARDQAHGGASIEWVPLAQASFIAERFRENGLHAWRAGARWSPNESLSFDLSRAQMLGGSELRWWTFGINLVFDR